LAARARQLPGPRTSWVFSLSQGVATKAASAARWGSWQHLALAAGASLLLALPGSAHLPPSSPAAPLPLPLALPPPQARSSHCMSASPVLSTAAALAMAAAAACMRASASCRPRSLGALRSLPLLVRSGLVGGRAEAGQRQKQGRAVREQPREENGHGSASSGGGVVQCRQRLPQHTHHRTSPPTHPPPRTPPPSSHSAPVAGRGLPAGASCQRGPTCCRCASPLVTRCASCSAASRACRLSRSISAAASRSRCTCSGRRAGVGGGTGCCSGAQRLPVTGGGPKEGAGDAGK
jgi:hypothetical protein